jgi:hypothetical protein
MSVAIFGEGGPCAHRTGVDSERLQVVEDGASRFVAVHLFGDVAFEVVRERACDRILWGKFLGAFERRLKQWDRRACDVVADGHIHGHELRRSRVLQQQAPRRGQCRREHFCLPPKALAVAHQHCSEKDEVLVRGRRVVPCVGLNVVQLAWPRADANQRLDFLLAQATDDRLVGFG